MIIPESPVFGLHGADPIGSDPLEGGGYLIYSRKRNLWHRKGSDGRPRGYAADILAAGIFDEATAREYDDEIDRAYPVAQARQMLVEQIETAEEALEEARRRLVGFDAGLSPAHRDPG